MACLVSIVLKYILVYSVVIFSSGGTRPRTPPYKTNQYGTALRCPFFCPYGNGLSRTGLCYPARRSVPVCPLNRSRMGFCPLRHSVGFRPLTTPAGRSRSTGFGVAPRQPVSLTLPTTAPTKFPLRRLLHFISQSFKHAVSCFGLACHFTAVNGCLCLRSTSRYGHALRSGI